MTPQEIKTLIKAKNLTQQRLARRLRVSQTSINFIIHGKPPSEKLLRRFARALGVEADDLPRGDLAS